MIEYFVTKHLHIDEHSLARVTDMASSDACQGQCGQVDMSYTTLHSVFKTSVVSYFAIIPNFLYP